MSIKLRNSIGNSGSLTFATAPKAITQAVAKASKVSNSGAMLYGHYATAWKGGAAGFAYTAAVMRRIGMILPGNSGERPTAKKAELKAFYSSDAIFRAHGPKGNGNLEFPTSATVRLTKAGFAYFGGRITGQTPNQSVDMDTVNALLDAMGTGKLAKAVPDYGTNTVWRAI